MNNIKIESLGPIEKADITFGDLTLFVGPQASGKSILLQLIKLIIDKNHIRKIIQQYGLIWGNNEDTILDRYFGEGMSGIWNDKTNIHFDNKPYSKSYLLPKKRESIKEAKEELFYVPAQRIVCLQYGWPRFFNDYENSVPYVLRHFSETLRQLLENNSGLQEDEIFPQNRRLKSSLRDSINESIFHNGKIVIDKLEKKRFKLNISNSSIPFMVWSAGQKEFMPLLLSFYWLCPSSKVSRKDSIQYVVIEEPEMGLHPQAIKSVILQIIDLLSRGYKVIVSTHSPVLLEFAWAFQFFRQASVNENAFYELFDLKKTNSLQSLFKDFAKTKIIKTYSFNRSHDKVTVKDISTLDAGSDDESVSEWGGLSSFSSRASDIISKIVVNADEE